MGYSRMLLPAPILMRHCLRQHRRRQHISCRHAATVAGLSALQVSDSAGLQAVLRDQNTISSLQNALNQNGENSICHPAALCSQWAVIWQVQKCKRVISGFERVPGRPGAAVLSVRNHDAQGDRSYLAGVNVNSLTPSTVQDGSITIPGQSSGGGSSSGLSTGAIVGIVIGAVAVVAIIRETPGLFSEIASGLCSLHRRVSAQSLCSQRRSNGP